MMRWLVTALITLSVSVFALGGAAAAQDLKQSCTGAGANSTFCQSVGGSQSQQDNSFYGKNGILAKVSNIIAVAAGFVAIIAIMVAGIRFIMADGDSGKIRESRNTIIYAVVGLFIILLARSIIAFVLSNWVS